MLATSWSYLYTVKRMSYYWISKSKNMTNEIKTKGAQQIGALI